MQPVGQKKQTVFFQNMGGINISDSPFAVKDNQALDGSNFSYSRTGAVIKALCPSAINSVADAQLRTLGLFLRNTKDNDKSIIRAAGTKLQLASLAGTFTNLTDDTAAGSSDVLASGTTKPVVGSMFVNPGADVLWLAGGGMSTLNGVCSSSKFTSNGVPKPTGHLTAMLSGGGGQWRTVGKYFYTLVFHKASTNVTGNAGDPGVTNPDGTVDETNAVESFITLSSITDSVLLNWSGLTNNDTTKYDTIYIYRSNINGVSGFTAGDIAAIVPNNPLITQYLDSGAFEDTAVNVPRAGGTLDDSQLPTGVYNTATTFKQRLVTTAKSTVYISDVSKPESWPISNVIQIPSGGDITGLAIISFATSTVSTATDEFLVVFKETELWIISGSDITTFALKFVDYAGAINQSLIVNANGYLYFVDNRGIHIWGGSGKPIYISRIIEPLFGVDGLLDRSKLNIGHGVFARQQNEVVWYLSHAVFGEQQFIIKLDLRQTLPNIDATIGERIMDGCFLFGKINNPAYASAAFVFPTSSNQEDLVLSGDNAGIMYRQFYATTGIGADDYDFSYTTKYLDMGTPSVTKRFEKVIAWVDNVGNWPLYLDYWSNFRTSDSDKHTNQVTVNPSTSGTSSLWDIAYWDQASWDNFMSAPRALAFNLTAAPYNNNEGEVIKLRFRNQNSDQPIAVLGFSVVYTELSQRQ